MWNKWQDSPVFVSFAETPTPVWDIPFPSITICSEIKIKQTLLNYTELCYNENKTLEEIEDFEKAALVCKSFTEFAVDFNRFFELGYEPENDTSVEGVAEFLRRVTLTNPADYSVDVSNQYFRIPFDRDMVVGIKPQVMTTSAGLKDYPSERRRCYFSRERYLKFFNVYTQQNCNLECFTNYTMKSCGCVTFFMPRREDVHQKRAAGRLQSARDDVHVNAVKALLEEHRCWTCIELAREVRVAPDLFASDDSGMEQCFCLPSCTEIKYDIETSQAVLSMADTFKALAENYHMDEIPDEMYSAVSFFYKDSQFVRSQRSELYGAVDFIASCGGLLGLCLGFSVLSVVEIFYFFTMRIYSNFQVLKKEK
ncbi:hypothetical protein C0J52_20176 [Blattella germanica]|nr:hypothetical protein C0J52_20176 [Blattella germanica]